MATATLTGRAEQTLSQSREAGVPRWLFWLFFLSGISGLMYQVVWVRMLTRILGHTVYATSTVLAAFMAGLALGSFLAGRWIDRSRRPLVWYALLEIGIGLSALSLLPFFDALLPIYQSVYNLAGESRVWLTAAQVALSLAALLVPTALMGATLPTLCAFGSRCREAFGRCFAALYALNTLGAVGGVVLSGFVLIGELGEINTVLVGVAINVAVGVAAWLLSPKADAAQAAGVRSPESGDGSQDSRPQTPDFRLRTGLRKVVLFTVAAGGFAAIANEVVWGRLLVLYLGTSIYAFSIMLAVVLAGMAFGSLLIADRLDRWADPLRQLTRLQFFLAVAGGLALHFFPLFADQLGGLVSVLLLGLMGGLWGVMLPLAVRCYSATSATAGRSVGVLYAWNTLGCILGALAAGFVLIPTIGAGWSGAVLGAVSLICGLALLAAHPDKPLAGRWRRSRSEWALITAGGVLLATVGDPYYRLVRKCMLLMFPDDLVVYYHQERAAGTTTAFGPSTDEPVKKHLWINGTGMTVLHTVTKVMAHLPVMLSEEPRDVLVICFGMGTTVRSASRYEHLEVTVVELVPEVIDCFGFYHRDGPEVLRRRNVRAVVDDGRNYLLMHSKQFDVITIDPAPPIHAAGTVNLYSREFFELCKARTRPGGVTCLWVPPAGKSEVKMILRTFLDVFPHVSVWTGPEPHHGFMGFFLLGTHRPLANVAQKVRKGLEPSHVRADLAEWAGHNCETPEQILALYIGDEKDLQAYLADSPVITDDRPYTEFPLWRALLKSEEYDGLFHGANLREDLKRFRRE